MNKKKLQSNKEKAKRIKKKKIFAWLIKKEEAVWY